MADVRVGVQKWAGDLPADGDHPPTAELGQHWVSVGNQKITAEDHGLIDVDYGVQEAGGIGVVTIRLYCSSFATVDKDEV